MRSVSPHPHPPPETYLKLGLCFGFRAFCSSKRERRHARGSTTHTSAATSNPFHEPDQDFHEEPGMEMSSFHRQGDRGGSQAVGQADEWADLEARPEQRGIGGRSTRGRGRGSTRVLN